MPCNFEDTLVFAAVGANLWLLFITRLTVATVTAYFASKVIDKSLANSLFEKDK